MAFQITGERTDFSINGLRTTGHSCSKSAIGPLPKSLTLIKLQENEGLKCESQNPTTFGDRAGYLCDPGARNNFLNRTQKHKQKGDSDKSDHIKIKNLCSSKDT